MSGQTDPRNQALSVLNEVLEGGAYANLAVAKALDKFSGAERDKGLVTELVYGSLRRLGELDAVLAQVSHRPLGDIDPVARNILRLSVYQVLFLRVPDHAAVDQGVRLAKHNGVWKASGFINATLRAVVSKPVSHWQEVIAATQDIEDSHPVWIARELESAWMAQEGASDFSGVLTAHNERPRVTLACLPGASEPLPNDTKTLWSPLGVVLAGGNPLADDRVAKGTARVQDEGSQLAALLLSRITPLTGSDLIADMCAGPGGKTAVLGAEAAVVGATVQAFEKVAHRAALVTDSVRAVNNAHPGTVTVTVADATTVTGQFDRILLDAPCTGLGALRRRPEARWRKHPEHLAELVALQKKLLAQAVSLLKPGGVIAYVTCSPVLSETTEVIEDALMRFPDLHTMDTPPVLDSIARTPVPHTRRGQAVQLWSHLHGTDSMFIQLLTVKSSG